MNGINCSCSPVSCLVHIVHRLYSSKANLSPHTWLTHADCAQAVQLSGKSQFPYMVDHNSGQQMGESDDIISYLYDEYGDGNVSLLLKLGPLTAISNTLALLPR